MLIDHAQAEGVRSMGIFDHLLAVADDKLARVGPVISHDAFDQRRLAGAVLAEQRVEAAGGHFQRHLVERGKGAKALGHRQHLETQRMLR